MPARMKVFFDGGCRPNPGEMEIAVVAGGQAHVRRDIGHGSSAEAEWLALIEALRLARTLDAPDFVLLGDALAVIRPATGAARCSSSAMRHYRSFLELAGECAPAIRYVSRSQNLAGIALAKLHPR